MAAAARDLEGLKGKGQAAMLEQPRLTARGLGGSCREGRGGFSRVLSV